MISWLLINQLIDWWSTEIFHKLTKSCVQKKLNPMRTANAVRILQDLHSSVSSKATQPPSPMPPTHIFTPFWNSFSLGHNVASNICLFSDLSVEPHEYDDRYLASLLLYVNKDRRSLSNIYQRRHFRRPFVDELNLSSTVVTRKEFSCIEEVLVIWIAAFLTFIGILITFYEILITFIGVFCNFWHIHFLWLWFVFVFCHFYCVILWYHNEVMITFIWVLTWYHWL